MNGENIDLTIPSDETLQDGVNRFSTNYEISIPISPLLTDLLERLQNRIIKASPNSPWLPLTRIDRNEFHISLLFLKVRNQKELTRSNIYSNEISQTYLSR